MSSPEGRRTYTVVGLGAIGGYYGARLAAAGFTVRFLARSGADQVRRNGLLVESPQGEVRLRSVEVYDDPTLVPASDVVLLAVKTTDNGSVLGHLPELAGPGSVVVVMQNGLGVEEAIAATVPESRVLGAMCFICSHKIGPGHVRHLDYGQVTVGEYKPGAGPAGVTDAVRAVASDLEAARVPVRTCEDLAEGRWRKLVWNIPFNGLSVLLDAGTDELMADPDTRSLVEDLMWEVVGAARACGHEIDDGFVETMLRTTDAMTPYKTSMKLDFDAGRPLELDAIYAAPIRVAAGAGYAMPHTAVLYRQLRFLDQRPGRG
ncbi:MAG: putative 2-dehydropantoate 2-reductase [Acidimicrobiales bacterium]|nr:putative 2-dehydropantoate 2-reductase [Acidimicrobiales bacterium]